MFCQTDSVAMASPLGPILANIFVGYYENSLLLDNSKLLAYNRYVDDDFAIFLLLIYNLNQLCDTTHSKKVV